MAWRYLSVMLLLAAPALARGDFLDADAARDWHLARVSATGRSYFYSGSEVKGCPAMTASCRRSAYVVHGNQVLVGEVKGALAYAAYTDTGGTPTTGWLPLTSVERIAVPKQNIAAWIGNWSYDHSTIDISRGHRPGRLKASGMAIWGMHDPERVRRGGINTGDFEGEATPTGDRLLFGPASESEDCRVSLRLIGPYLAAIDNGNCGGMNVTFSGIYRR